MRRLMNVLHVMCTNFLSGSTNYVLTLAAWQIKTGHQVYIITDDATLETSAKLIPLPISDRSYPQRVKNIFFIRKFILAHGIHLVHAHSRASSWVSYFATLGLKTPLVSTIHGRQQLHLSVKLFDIYGDRVISICPHLTRHLVEEVGMKPEKIHQIPNGADFSSVLELLQSTSNPTPYRDILLIGRLNGRKGVIAAQITTIVFPQILEKYADVRLFLIGGGYDELPLHYRVAINDLQKRFPDRIILTGFVNDVPKRMAAAHAIIGAGRVGIGALALQKPLFAIGEACYHGLINKENLQQAINSNYGDILPCKNFPAFDWQQFQRDLDAFLAGLCPMPEKCISHQVINFYNIEEVFAQIHRVYEKAIAHRLWPRHIPILMYHKTPAQPIDCSHSIYVTRSTIGKHLQLIRWKRLQPITFSDYLAYVKGELPLQTAPKRPIILTFDDGYRDNYENLLPLMERYGYKGVIFLLGDSSITYNYWDADRGYHRAALMDKAQRLAFAKAGWEIGAHTMTHPDLTQLSEEEAFAEIVNSKLQLEKEINKPVQVFAYPFGFYNEKVKKMVQQAGFDLAVATDSGGMHIEEDRFRIFRTSVFPRDGWFQMFKKTSWWYRKYYRWKRKI
ncbi:MAG: polysaccharide deacetylase family protein [Cytophagales bacterium]|nr:polysaccharide deacetylase family protein [Bernardetiaceae bacterium]MDW8211768.1 polysaccharide deacetylase family protein [Cytophagales bacterium]